MCRKPELPWLVNKVFLLIFHWNRKWQPTPVILPGQSHGQRNWVGYSPWCCKESETTEHTHTHTHILIFHMLEHLEEKTKATKEVKEGS